jgi:hypothetical protein
MSGQPEPDGGVWQDRNGDVWTQSGDDRWGSVGCNARSWAELCGYYGPLVPLIPDPVALLAPGAEPEPSLADRLEDVGRDTPLDRDSLEYLTPEERAVIVEAAARLRELEDILGRNLTGDAATDLRVELAHEVGRADGKAEAEANYQSATSESQVSSKPYPDVSTTQWRHAVKKDLGGEA